MAFVMPSMLADVMQNDALRTTTSHSTIGVRGSRGRVYCDAVELPAASMAAKTRLCDQGQAARTATRMTSTSSSRVGPGAYVGRQPSW